MISKKYRFLKGYDPDHEAKKEAYFELLKSTNDRDIRKDCARGIASLTSLRSSTFVTALERTLGLRHDD
jgi:hypothetical protein